MEAFLKQKIITFHMKKCLFFFTLILVFAACKQNDPAPLPPTAQPMPRLLDTTQVQQDLQLLSSDEFMGRNPSNAAISLTYQLIQNRLRQAGVDSFALGFEQNFSISGVPRKNFLGLVKGTVNPNEYIVVSAHFDHLGKTAAGVFHGADDNASGVAAVLAMAKYFKQHPPKHSIIFALWDAEEVGLKGAEFFVNNLPAPLTLNQVKFNLNLDMVARSDNNKLWASGLSHYPNFKYLVDSLKQRTTTQLGSGFDKPTDPQDWTYLSDHGSFHRKGIAFVYLGVEDHADYHKVTDTYDKINLQKYFENAQLAANMLVLVDRKL